MENFDLKKYLTEGKFTKTYLKENQDSTGIVAKFSKYKPLIDLDGTHKQVTFQIQGNLQDEDFQAAKKHLIDQGYEVNQDQSHNDYMEDDDRDIYPRIIFKEKTKVEEEYNVGKGMEKDHDFDAMLAHALKLHAGTKIEDLKKVAHDFEDVNYHRELAHLEDAIDMLEAGKHEEFEDSLNKFKEDVKKTIRSFNESVVTEEEEAEGTNFDYDYADIGQFYLEGLNKPFELDEDELKELGESIVRIIYKGDIKAAYDAIVHKKDLSEDLDIGHEDNEPGMLKADLYKIGKQAMELYQIMDNLEGKGEIDFPHWWQSKINTAKNMIDGAKHYLEFEINEPAIDATIDAVDMEESIDREFHTTSNTNGHPNWKDLSADEIQDYIDAPSIPLWGRELRTAEMVRDQKIDSTVTEDISLDDEAKAYFMGKVKKGEIDTLPEDPKAEYLAQMTKDQMDHDKETSHKEGELEEDSFYTDDIKNKVVSKLMDQLKK